jgi:hypothetical protein
MAGGYSGQLFANAFKVVLGQTSPEDVLAAGDYPASGSYIDVSKTERFHCLVHFGAIHGSDVPVIEIKQTTAADGTLTTISTTDAKHTAEADDDDEWVTFTIETKKLTEDNHFVSAVVSGVTNASYGDISFLLPELDLPVAQTTAVLPAASQHNFTG